MRFLKVMVAAVALLAGIVAWIVSTLHDARSAVHTLCTTTRTGEPVPQLEARVKQAGLSLEPVSAPGAVPEELRVTRSALGRHFGCVFEIRDRRVQATRFGELPSS
jgi:hypothetical protein